MEQALLNTVRDKEDEFETLKKDFADLGQLGESEVQANLKQLSSRFQAVQNISKVRSEKTIELFGSL